MATSTYAALRYPVSSDSPNIAQYFQNLAADVDNKVEVVVANPTARSALSSTFAGMRVYEQSTGRWWRRDTANAGWNYGGGAPPPIVLCTVFGGWTGSAGQLPAVYKNGDGLVCLAGRLTNNTNYIGDDGGTHQLITLPTGYRPAATFLVGLYISGVQTATAEVRTDGEIRVITTRGATILAGAGHLLSGIPPFHPGYAGGALS